jgi:hypothetical protein
MRRLSLLVLLGALLFGFCQTAVAESPIVITPVQWFTGEMDLGSSSATTFSIRNESMDALLITGFGFESGSSPDFTVTQGPSLPFRLESYEEVTLEITFQPGSEGLHAGALQVEYIPAEP